MLTRFLLSVAVLALMTGIMRNSDFARAGAVCSIVPFPMVRDSETTVFIGRATPDTLPAGAGLVRYTVRGGHWSSNRQDRSVYGQRVLVQRIGGANTDALATVFSQRADSSVLIVPWDYDPACQPALWGRSFVWTAPESVGVFTVRLRPEAHWAGQWPTFDAFMADIEPYPHGIFYQEGYRQTDAVRRGEGLSVAEFFEFYLSLPGYDPYGPDSLRYRKALCDWAAAHPHQVKRFPASRLLQFEPCS